jgi:multicomponent Na+:H+ antiporter subunit D
MSDAALASLLPLPVAVPLAGAVVAPLTARISRRLPAVIGLLAMLGSTGLLAAIAPTVFSGHVLAHYMGHWTPVRGHALGIAFAADPFGLTFALVTAGIGALLLLSTLSELGGLGARELGGLACLCQLLLAALIGAALTADLFNLFVWFEVAALASYGLTGFFLERPLALEAAFKILVLTTVASFGIFIGAGLLYANHGALNMAQLHVALAARTSTADLIALGLLVGGFATKAGLVPFHGWLADAHTAAPGPVSALFSGLMVNLGVVAIARLAYCVFPSGDTVLLGALTVLGLVSALLGALLALAQQDLKRLLAYDTVSQMGVLSVGLGTGSATGVAGATYHLINHALFKSLLFLAAGAIVHTTGQTRLEHMGGLARRKPLLAAAFLLGTASIAGVPPFNGYASLSLIHRALLDQHAYLPYALLLLAQLVTIGALGRACYLAFFAPARGAAAPRTTARLHAGMVTALGGLGACCVAFGVLPGPTLRHLAAPAASGLTNSASYVAGVLSGWSRLPHLSIPLDYGEPAELDGSFVSLFLATLLVRWYLGHREPTPVRVLRAAHNGSVNDYAALVVAGTLGLITALALARGG